MHDHAGHSHSHAHARSANARRLAIVLGLVLVYIVAEVIGGLLTNSLALLADAGHMLSDAAALGLSLFALWIARRPASPKHSYGFYRAEILAALVNGATLVAIALVIFVEAWQRFRAPPVVEGRGVMLIATGGLAEVLSSETTRTSAPGRPARVNWATCSGFTDVRSMEMRWGGPGSVVARHRDCMGVRKRRHPFARLVQSGR